MIFEGTELVKNADGEYVPHVYGYSAITGNKLLIEIERTELLDNPVISLSDMSLTGSPVHTGDIIRYALNAKGQISLVQRHVAYDGSEGAAIPATQGYGKRGGYYVTTRGSYGRVVNYNKSRMLIRYEEDDGSIWIEPRALRSDMHVFLYNDIRGVNSLTKVTLDELYSDNLHGRGDMISSFSYGATMNTIVIYRH